MKRHTLTALLTALTMTALTACGDTSATDKLIAKSESSSSAAATTAATAAAQPESSPAPAGEADSTADESEIDDYLSYVPPPSTRSFAEGIDAKNGDIDVDLTQLNATMTYSQVYDMIMNPDLYTGKTIRAKGTFAHTFENDRDYFAAIVQDATACCSQGIEFVLAEDKKFPDDYPPIDTEIIITGTFSSYKESVFTYIELHDAVLEVSR